MEGPAPLLSGNEGFICPVCRHRCMSPNDLVTHWHSLHGAPAAEPAATAAAAPAPASAQEAAARPSARRCTSARQRLQERVIRGARLTLLCVCRRKGLPREVALLVRAFAASFDLAEYRPLRSVDAYGGSGLLPSQAYHRRHMLRWQPARLARSLLDLGVHRRGPGPGSAAGSGGMLEALLRPSQSTVDLGASALVDALARRLFDGILRFAGDAPCQRPSDCLLRSLATAQRLPKLSDELFVQVLKQLRRHPGEASAPEGPRAERARAASFARYCRVLWLLCVALSPAEDLLPFVLDSIARLERRRPRAAAGAALSAARRALAAPSAVLLAGVEASDENFLGSSGQTALPAEEAALLAAAAAEPSGAPGAGGWDAPPAGGGGVLGRGPRGREVRRAGGPHGGGVGGLGGRRGGPRGAPPGGALAPRAPLAAERGGGEGAAGALAGRGRGGAADGPDPRHLRPAAVGGGLPRREGGRGRPRSASGAAGDARPEPEGGGWGGGGGGGGGGGRGPGRAAGGSLRCGRRCRCSRT